MGVGLLWIPFRAGSEARGWQLTWTYYERLFSWAPGAIGDSAIWLVALCLALLVLASWRGQRWLVAWPDLSVWRQGLLLGLGAVLILIFAPGGSGFIYFVF